MIVLETATILDALTGWFLVDAVYAVLSRYGDKFFGISDVGYV